MHLPVTGPYYWDPAPTPGSVFILVFLASTHNFYSRATVFNFQHLLLSQIMSPDFVECTSILQAT